MKKKFISFIITFCFIISAICALSACASEKLYEMEITTTTQIDHIKEIRFSSTSKNKTTYRNSENSSIEVICKQGYAPDLVFTIGEMQISKYEESFVDIIDDSVDPTIITVLYIYVIPTKDLSGKQTVTYSGSTKDADVILELSLSDEGQEDYSGYDWDGLKFKFEGLADNKTQEFTVLGLVNFTKANQRLLLDYNKPMTITLLNTSSRTMLYHSGILNIYDKYLVEITQSDDTDSQQFISWTIKSDVNFSISLVLKELQVFHQEEDA